MSKCLYTTRLLLRQGSGGHLPGQWHPVQPSGWAGGWDTGHRVGAELLHLHLHRGQPSILWVSVTNHFHFRQSTNIAFGFH